MNGDHVQEARLAVGCAGPKPLRLTELEDEIRGASLAEAKARLRATRDELTELLEPVDDLLGSASYKVYLAGVLLARALEEAAQNNGATHHA